MTPIDQQLYELFFDGVNPPQLHDVFRVAKEKGLLLVLTYLSEYDSSHVISFWKKGSIGEEIPYNPTLPLLLQSYDTKSAIISLFK